MMRIHSTRYFRHVGALCAFILWQGAATAQTQELDRIVAVVNEEIIPATALVEEIRTVASELERQQRHAPSQAALEKQVLERLILTRLQLQLADQTGIKVDDSDLNEALHNIAAQNNLNLEQFREIIEKDDYSFARFRESIREEMTVQRLQQRQVVSRVNVSTQEINNFLANQARQGTAEAEYHLMHILIAVPEGATPDILKEKEQKSQEIVKKLRAGADFKETAVAESDSQQALEGGDLGWRKAGEVPSLFLSIVPSMQVGEISEPIRNAGGFHIIKLAELRNVKQSVITQTHARHILLKTGELVADADAENRLKLLQERIRQGDDFAELARGHSEDAASAAQGGDLDWISPGSMVSEFEAVMDKLQTGEVSAPFKSRFGWHIVQVLARRQHDNTTEALRVQAAKQIRRRKIEDELQTWLRQLRDEAYIEIRLDDED